MEGIHWNTSDARVATRHRHRTEWGVCVCGEKKIACTISLMTPRRHPPLELASRPLRTHAATVASLRSAVLTQTLPPAARADWLQLQRSRPPEQPLPTLRHPCSRPAKITPRASLPPLLVPMLRASQPTFLEGRVAVESIARSGATPLASPTASAPTCGASPHQTRRCHRAAILRPPPPAATRRQADDRGQPTPPATPPQPGTSSRRGATR